METNIYIPKKLKVGYQKRLDTYSKKLAYVIYYDDKGVLKKEKSWTGWIDSKIPTDEFDNLPMEGFVLNRNVGGAKLSWGHDVRIEKVRVFDPRGFEIEIDVPNVLFILNECTSVKGKGLDGTFVYGWNGQNLTLIPTSCEEYKQAQNFTAIQGGTVDIKSLIAGAVYRTKKMKDLVYLGRFDWFQDINTKDGWVLKPTKKHIFANLNPEYGYDDMSLDDFEDEGDYNDYLLELEEEKQIAIENGDDIEFLPLANTATLAVCLSDVPVSNYAELLERFAISKNGSAPVEFIEIEGEPTPEIVMKNDWPENKDKSTYFMKNDNGSYSSLNIEPADKYNREAKHDKFSLSYHNDIQFTKKGEFIKNYSIARFGAARDKKYTIDQIKKLGLVKLNARLLNNKISKVEKFV